MDKSPKLQFYRIFIQHCCRMIIMLIAVLFVGCNGSTGKQQEAEETDNDSIISTPIMSELQPNTNGTLIKSKDMNGSAYNVFCVLQNKKKGNFVCSPYGIAALYRMLADGAESETLNAIENIISVSSNDISNIAMDLVLSQEGKTTEGAIVENCNLIAVDLQQNLLDGYSKAMKSRYLCDIQHLDLTKKASINRLNAFIKERTHGLITDILDEQALGSNLIALNTIFFKGYWQMPFHESDTFQKPFKNLDGSIKTVDMMHTYGHIYEYPYFDTNKFQAVALNYIPRECSKGKMNKYALYVFLPHPDASLADVTDYLAKNDIKSIQRKFEKNKTGDDVMIQISLPKFTSRTGFDVTDVLDTLGLKQQALFTRITESPLVISRSIQQAVIELNEKYTEAAAVTVTYGLTGPAIPEDTFIFYANRPFIYTLVNEETGTIFFIGQYVDGQIYKDGKWQSIDNENTFTTPPMFVEGSHQVSPRSTDVSNRYSTDMSDPNAVYQVTEQMPEFPGGDEKLLDFIKKNLRYPKEAIQNNIQGRVICEFIVEKDGTLSNTKIVRSLSPECDKEAIRIINAMPKWEPGRMRNVRVRTIYTIPVAFRLSEAK